MKENNPYYNVRKLTQEISIDGNWNKPQWQECNSLIIDNYLGPIPRFLPAVQAKMMYSEENLYVIFQVKDYAVRCITKEINGPVWEDACVEFFFSPDKDSPLKYYNLEVNCGGTPLMHFNNSSKLVLDKEIIKKIEIAHSLPQISDPEIKNELFWTIEYRIPISILRINSEITKPEKGVIWQANFYNCSENNSNPHWITWSVIKNGKLDFHQPEFFGELIFQ